MHRAHPLALRAERQFRDPGRSHPGLLLLQSCLCCQHHQRAFRRVAFDEPAPGIVDQRGIGAQQSARQHEPYRVIVEWQRRIEAALGSVSRPADLAGATAHEHPARRHLAFGQRARLVGADHRGASQRFHGGHAPHQRIALGHLVHRDSERTSHDCRQRLRNRGHRERDRKHCYGQYQIEVEFVSHPRSRDTDDDRDTAHADGDQPQPAADLRGPLFEWGRLPLYGGDLFGDLAEFRTHSRARYDCLAATIGHRCAGKYNVATIADGQVARQQRQVLFDWKGLSRQRCFIAFERMNFGEARINRYAVAGLQEHDVPGDEFPGRNARLDAVSQHRDRVRQHALQRIKGLVGAVFLHETEHGAEHHDHEYDGRVDGLPQRRGEYRCN